MKIADTNMCIKEEQIRPQCMNLNLAVFSAVTTVYLSEPGGLSSELLLNKGHATKQHKIVSVQNESVWNLKMYPLDVGMSYGLQNSKDRFLFLTSQ